MLVLFSSKFIVIIVIPTEASLVCDQVLPRVQGWGREEGKEGVIDERTTDVLSYNIYIYIYINMWTVSSDVSTERHHWQLPSFLWAYPTHEVNDVMFEGWSHHRGLRPLLFSNSGVGSFYILQEPDKCKACFKSRATAVLSWLDCNTTCFQTSNLIK